MCAPREIQSSSHTLSNVKIEVLTGTRELADKDSSMRSKPSFYADYSIITYIYQVEACAITSSDLI